MDASDTITLKDGTIAVASQDGRRMLADRVEWIDYPGTQCPECGVLDTNRSWHTI